MSFLLKVTTDTIISIKYMEVSHYSLTILFLFNYQSYGTFNVKENPIHVTCTYR